MDTKKATPTTVDEYIAQFPQDVQLILKKVRAVIKETAPQAEEKLSYQMPYYSLNGRLVYFAAHSHHLGLYPMGSGVEAFKDELSEYKLSKGTVQFPFDKPIPYELIRKVVRFRVVENLKKVKAKAAPPSAQRARRKP